MLAQITVCCGDQWKVPQSILCSMQGLYDALSRPLHVALSTDCCSAYFILALKASIA